MNSRLHHLIEQHLSGKLTPSEQNELHQLLSESAENREVFCTQGIIDGRLRWEMGNTLSEHPAMDEPQSQASHKKWMAIAALLILSLILSSIVHQSFDAPGPSSDLNIADSPTTNQPIRSVARLTSEKQAQWLINGSSQSLPSGFWLKPGTWKITQGAATITLDSGAKITVVSPASVKLINSNHARLINGTVSVDVPEPAIGFTLDTPTGRVVDLSTRFSVSVENGQDEEVHVLEGEVIVQYGENHQQSQLIGNKSAIRLSASSDSSPVTPAPFRPDSYPREVKFTPRALIPDQDIGYVHWSFDEVMEPSSADSMASFAASGTLTEAHACSADVVTPLKQQAPLTTKGTFGKALHLNGDGTWLKTHFPGVAGAQARTIAFWVRIPPHAQDRQAYSIIGWGHAEPHHLAQKWEIGWNTARFPVRGTGVKGAIRTDFGSGHTIGSTDLRDGRWHHIVSVFTGGEHADAATHIRHYVDGRFEGVSAYRQQVIDTKTETSKSIPAVIGKYLHPKDKAFGTFQGSIDELYVFNAALTPSQILQLQHTNTTPASGDLLPTPQP